MPMLPDTQLTLRPGMVEFGWGHPDPALLPAADLAYAAELALRRNGPAALSYGAEQGPGQLLAALVEWLSHREGGAISPEHLFVTGGVSQGLDLLCTLLTRPGDVVLVQAPVYHLALRIFADYGLTLVPVASDEGGLCVEAVAAAVERLAAEGKRPRFLYAVPTWCNPTGVSLAGDRRRALAELVERRSLLILEDDVYRELWYGAPSPSALSSLAPDNVIRLGSFAKILAPGLRLGWLVAPPALVQRCVACGLLDSGGGVNHFAAHVVAAYLDLGLLDGHTARLREAYQGRRDVLLAALARHLPAGCRWGTPGGGYFAWVELPDGCDSAALLPAAEAAGVSYVPGARFYTGGGATRYLRLAFSLLGAAELEEGVQRLGTLFRAER